MGRVQRRMMDGIRSVLVAIAANSAESQSIPVAMRAICFAELAGATAWACAPQFHGQRQKDGVIDAGDRQVQPRNLVVDPLARLTLPSESVSHKWLSFVVVVAVEKLESVFCFPAFP
jgi:hypothetical protein